MKKTALDYIAEGLNPEYKLWDYIDVDKMAKTLNVDYWRLIEFLQADDRCDCYYYSEEQCEAEYQELLNDFRECQNDTGEPMRAAKIYTWGY